tara:strand:+ start:1456 stop:1707 length:252 start_codon:yes stop_codon:yes gene_type:complete
MLINLIYILIAAILIFVLYLAVKAITRGVEAKSDLKSEKDEEEIINNQIENTISQELEKIKKLHDDGSLNDEEFKKAKDKILK